MILPITQYGDPVLRKKCPKLKEVTEEMHALVQDMLETMRDADGIGLAGPQIGQELRLAVVDVSHDPECVSYLKVNGEDCELAEIMPFVFLNPDFELEGEKSVMEEGCLSIADVRAKVRRPVALKGTFEMLDGSTVHLETDGLLARVIQHETDHLNGILFVDRLTTAAKVTVRSKLKRLIR